jgi:hypothetical protein
MPEFANAFDFEQVNHFLSSSNEGDFRTKRGRIPNTHAQYLFKELKRAQYGTRGI